MPVRDWAAIRKGLIATYNPAIAGHFGATPSAADNESIQLMTVKSNDSSLIAQSRITLFNQQFPSSGGGDAVCPDGWLIRPEYHRPQAIYQFAEVDDSGKIIGSPKYRITIPHHKPEKLVLPKPPFPNYQRGNWEIIFVLKDNSKITIHSFDKTEGDKILSAAKDLVDPNYLNGAYESKSCLVGTTTPITKIKVKCRMAKFYATGCLTLFPTWLVKW
ncbi:MAG: hypothetical protein V7K27_05210 [Nostoc sp.]|uniref:hypothetical protein n=1 Tax=Nostoc sp. TaxID=1180 RepID=UPI002FF68D17